MGKTDMLPEPIQTITDEFIPVLKQLAVGRYAVAISGSFGKGTFDRHSDLDFRIYGDDLLSDENGAAHIKQRFQSLTAECRERGYRIDDYWPRKIDYIDRELSTWTAGTLNPLDLTWTIWGYHILPDLYHQHVLDDPFGILNGWKEQLRTYPQKLKYTIFEKHLKFVKYWRDDYHYVNKVRRRDVVFLSGLTSKIVHSLIQLLFALNETYYVGDGNNLDFLKDFKCIPERFTGRIETVLLPERDSDGLVQQRESLVELINDVEALVKS